MTLKYRRNNPWKPCQVIEASGSGSMTFQTPGMSHSIPGRDRLRWKGLCCPFLGSASLLSQFPGLLRICTLRLLRWGRFCELQSRGMRFSMGPGRSWARGTEPACSTQLNLALFAHKGSRNWFQTTLPCCGLSPILEGTGNYWKLGRRVLKLFPAPFKNKSGRIFQLLL